MVEIRIAYEGQLRCKAVHVPSGNSLFTDAPVDNLGKGEAFSPTDLVATALGTCILTILGIVARKQGLDIQGAAATVRKEMVSQPFRRIGRLAVDIRVPGEFSEEDRRRLEDAARSCPVFRSLLPEIEIPIAFRWGS